MMLIEIAKAIAAANGDDWDREGDGLMEAYAPLARAAVAAFRDLGDAQIEAASQEIEIRQDCCMGIYASDVVEVICDSIIAEVS